VMIAGKGHDGAEDLRVVVGAEGHGHGAGLRQVT
jgi:hypothetical protein